MEDYNEIIRKELISLHKQVEEGKKLKAELIAANEMLRKNVADLQSQYYEMVKQLTELKKRK